MTYSPWSAWVASFYSTHFYRHVARYWRPVCLAYLLGVLVICWAPSFIEIHWLANRVGRQIQANILPQIPALRFENGQFSTPEAKPYLINLGNDKTPLDVIIDTSGHVQSLDGRNAYVLITRDKLFMRQRGGETRIYDLSKSRTRAFIITPDRIRRILHPLKYWALGALYLGILIASYIKRLIQAFFIALFGLILSSLLKLELDLGALLSLAIVSMTPVMTVEAIVHSFGKGFHGLWLLWFVLTTGYFLFALNAASDKAGD